MLKIKTKKLQSTVLVYLYLQLFVFVTSVYFNRNIDCRKEYVKQSSFERTNE